MLKAFIDDSRMGQPPVYVLAGWIAPAKTWAKFSDEWAAVLRMSPRIEYFKFAEAMNFNGEFHGVSLESRNEKMNLLLRVIEDHKLLGALSIIPHSIFLEYFGRHPNREVRNPYFPSLHGLVSRIIQHNIGMGIKDRLELFFDYQPGHADQMEAVRQGWEEYRRAMPQEARDLVQAHPPTFLDDRDVVALQAADLLAGWARAIWESKLERTPAPYWPWGPRVVNILSIKAEWTTEIADALYEGMFGHKPVKTSWLFGHGLRRDVDPKSWSVN